MPEINLPTKTLQTTISDSIGSTTDTASSTGSVHAKLKDIKNSLGVSSVIKSIQKGSAIIGGGTVAVDSVPVSINAVVVGKSFLIFSFTAPSADFTPKGKINSATQLFFDRKIANTATTVIEWQVIEFY